MGIDVYMRWKGQTEEEVQAQYTGFSVQHGHVGYLREAFHGTPYATAVLVPDELGDGETPVLAATLRANLPAALVACEDRVRKIYNGSDEDVKQRQKAYIDFVELAEKKEAEIGEPVKVLVS